MPNHSISQLLPSYQDPSHLDVPIRDADECEVVVVEAPHHHRPLLRQRALKRRGQVFRVSPLVWLHTLGLHVTQQRDECLAEPRRLRARSAKQHVQRRLLHTKMVFNSWTPVESLAQVRLIVLALERVRLLSFRPRIQLHWLARSICFQRELARLPPVGWESAGVQRRKRSKKGEVNVDGVTHEK